MQKKGGMDNENKFYNIYRLCRKERAWLVNGPVFYNIIDRSHEGYNPTHHLRTHLATVGWALGTVTSSEKTPVRIVNYSHDMGGMHYIYAEDLHRTFTLRIKNFVKYRMSFIWNISKKNTLETCAYMSHNIKGFQISKLSSYWMFELYNKSFYSCTR